MESSRPAGTLLRRPWVEALLTTLVVGFATLITNTISNYLTQPELEVVVGDAVANASPSDSSKIPIFITSRRTAEISGLSLEIPHEVDPNRIERSRAIKATLNSDAKGGSTRLVLIDRIPGQALTSLIIPIAGSQPGAQSIQVRPPVGVRTKVKNYEPVSGRFEAAIKAALLLVLLNGFIYFVVVWFFFRVTLPKMQELKEKAETIQSTLDANNAQIDKIQSSHREEVANVDRRFGRIKALLLARIVDLQKELTFWRSFVKDLALKGGASKSDAEMLTTLVTERLNTWAAHEQLPGMVALRIAAGMLDRGDKALRDLATDKLAE